MSIQRLPGDVTTKIKSSTTVASLNDAVLGLLCNALDAGASLVTVQVDYSRGSCSVADDGSGIPPAEFLPDGGLGKLYCTSKYPLKNGIHGRRGTFLASAAALSLLSVVSRFSDESESTLIIHNGKVVRRQTLAVGDIKSVMTCRGTRVTVNDLFGCIPVRARLRPSPESPAWSRDWDSLIRAVAALLMAWPSDIAVTIEDKVNGTKRSLKAQGPDDAIRAARLLVQAGLCEVTSPASWVEVDESVTGIRISGSFCLEPVASKRMQFLRIGVEPLSEAHHADNLYAEINKIVAESNFGAATDRNGSGPRDSRGPIDKFVREQRPAKAIDRWPMFCLGIDIDGTMDVDDVLDDRRHHSTMIVGLLRTMLGKFLESRGFYENSSTLYGSDNGPDTAPASPTKKQKLADSDASHRTTRGKSKCGGQQSFPERNKSTYPPTSLFSSWPQTKSSRPLKAKPATANFGTGEAIEVVRGPKVEETSKFFAASESCLEAEDAEDGHNGEGCVGHSQMEDWDGNNLTSGDLKISRASLETATIIGQVDHKFIFIRASADDREASADDRETKQPGKTNDETTGPLLIIIDQHAADERCRVESLLDNYFVRSSKATKATASRIANKTVLDWPLQFELDPNERLPLERTRAYFGHWGVIYDVMPLSDENKAGPTVLRVLGLPTCIAERCRQEPRLVVDLIRKEIWARDESDLAVPHHGSDVSWAATMHSCPRGILELINSRACRSAIKFNDPLTREQCCDLLRRLLRCSFPFQCAHGRPSMVPLLHLGASDLSQDDDVW